MNVQELPLVNASLNGAATALIIAGLIAIKSGRTRLHKFCMASAIVVSAAFLACYLTYHFNVVAVTKFTHQGWARNAYFFILLTHIPLAIAVLPLLGLTVWPAIKGEYETHKKWARIAAPVWLYVSVTGVLVYLMLYVWYPPQMIQ
jgi:uncharacterized membrane protein YozB (DUF420 family)